MDRRTRGWISILYIGLLFVLTGRTGFCQDDVNPMYSFSLEKLHEENSQICSYPSSSNSGLKSILFKPKFESVRFTIPGYEDEIPYKSSGYLVIDVEHDNPASLVLILEFQRKGDKPNNNGRVNARITCRIGVLPNLPTRVIFPLSHLNAQSVFLPKVPRQLKGTLNGSRMEIREIEDVHISLKNTRRRTFPQQIHIQGVYIFDEIPPELSQINTPLVDSLGQWGLKDWDGKVYSFGQLAQEIENIEDSFENIDYSEKKSPFMGFTDLQFESTGFFRTHHDGKRWWLVDPMGYAYLSVGPTGVRAFSHGPVENNEELFSWLPEVSGKYKGAYARQRGLLSLSFVTLNLMRLWGDDFLTDWLRYTSNLIKSLGFTSSANWTDPLFHQQGGLPYFYPMSGFPTTKVKIFRDFPDVFDPAYEQSANEYARQLEIRKNDSLMVGYFLGNEPHWAFGEFNLARELLYKNEQSFTRKELISWLRIKYHNDPYLLSAKWGYEFQSFQDLNYFILPHENDISSEAETDLMEFSVLMVDRYTKTICDATKAVDPNHLNLGLRFAWISSQACLQAGRYFDVFSLNGYTFPEPPETQVIVDELDKPVLIGEFHFGSIDKGLPASGLIGVKTQTGRGNAYRHYVEQGFARPELVGIHYFQWNDQPITGRFDGENYNIGIVDVTYRPYLEMADKIKKTNSRLFSIATGKRAPYRWKARTIPAIYY